VLKLRALAAAGRYNGARFRTPAPDSYDRDDAGHLPKIEGLWCAAFLELPPCLRRPPLRRPWKTPMHGI
jgi:hypothetical protein